MLERAFDSVLGFVGADAAQTSAVLALILIAIYMRRAMGLGSTLSDWTSKLVFTLIVLALLLLTGIVPGINVGAAIGLVEGAVSVVADLIGVFLTTWHPDAYGQLPYILEVTV